MFCGVCAMVRLPWKRNPDINAMLREFNRAHSFVARHKSRLMREIANKLANGEVPPVTLQRFFMFYSLLEEAFRNAIIMTREWRNLETVKQSISALEKMGALKHMGEIVEKMTEVVNELSSKMDNLLGQVVNFTSFLKDTAEFGMGFNIDELKMQAEEATEELAPDFLRFFVERLRKENPALFNSLPEHIKKQALQSQST